MDKDAMNLLIRILFKIEVFLNFKIFFFRFDINWSLVCNHYKFVLRIVSIKPKHKTAWIVCLF